MKTEYTLLLIGILLVLTLAVRVFASAMANILRRKMLRRAPPPGSRDAHTPRRPRRLLAVLGSGGHTAEMLKLVCDVAGAGTSVVYAVSEASSEARAAALHANGAPLAKTQCVFRRLPRARKVGERFLHAAPRAALCALASVPLLLHARPEIVLCNGPGTSAIIALVAIVLNAAGMLHTRVIYAESVARVTSLSLSGKMLYPFAHRFLVQWPQLKQRYPWVEYHGRYS